MGGDGTWGMIWREVRAVGVGTPKCLLLEFVGNLGAVPSCCFAFLCLCPGPTLETSGGDRDFWILVSAQVGRVMGTIGEIVVVCTLGGGEPREVGDTLGDSVGSQWECKGGASGM